MKQDVNEQQILETLQTEYRSVPRRTISSEGVLTGLDLSRWNL
jgi:hypothetical protein